MKKSLVVIEARETTGFAELSKAVAWMDSEFELLAVSSIYELKSAEIERLASRKLKLMQSGSLSVAVSIESLMSPNELLDAMTLQQAKWNADLAHSSVHLYLLFYESVVSMLPNLYIPHPEWLERKDWLLASTDLWPNFEHPVLEDSLAHIGRGKKIRPGDYFFAQGKMLLNPEMPAT